MKYRFEVVATKIVQVGIETEPDQTLLEIEKQAIDAARKIAPDMNYYTIWTSEFIAQENPLP